MHLNMILTDQSSEQLRMFHIVLQKIDYMNSVFYLIFISIESYLFFVGKALYVFEILTINIKVEV